MRGEWRPPPANGGIGSTYRIQLGGPNGGGRLEQLHSRGGGDRLRPVARVEAGEQRLHVSLDGVVAQVQPIRNHGVRIALCNQLEYLALARREMKNGPRQ